MDIFRVHRLYNHITHSKPQGIKSAAIENPKVLYYYGALKHLKLSIFPGGGDTYFTREHV
jgi:hypothetical protein